MRVTDVTLTYAQDGNSRARVRLNAHVKTTVPTSYLIQGHLHLQKTTTQYSTGCSWGWRDENTPCLIQCGVFVIWASGSYLNQARNNVYRAQHTATAHPQCCSNAISRSRCQDRSNSVGPVRQRPVDCRRTAFASRQHIYT